jgi:hypothetical protein
MPGHRQSSPFDHRVRGINLISIAAMHNRRPQRVRPGRADHLSGARADGLSWKTTRRFRRMLRSRALAANADALKHADMTDLGGSMFLRLPGNTIGGETP